MSVDEVITGIRATVQADQHVTVIQLADYVVEGIEIDSVTMMGERLEFNGSEIHIHDWPAELVLGRTKLWSQGFPFVIPVKRPREIDYTFRFDPKSRDFGSVSLKGDMNDWVAEAMEFNADSGVYELDLLIAPGDYQYQMVLDGQAFLDFNNPNTDAQADGSFFSVLDLSEHEGDPIRLTSSVTDDGIRFKAAGSTDLLVLWQNQELEVEVKGEEYFVEIPRIASSVDRSFVKVWAYNDEAISNDLLIPLDHGAVIQNAAALGTKDEHAFSFVLRASDPIMTKMVASETEEVVPRSAPRVDHTIGRGLLECILIDSAPFGELDRRIKQSLLDQGHHHVLRNLCGGAYDPVESTVDKKKIQLAVLATIPGVPLISLLDSYTGIHGHRTPEGVELSGVDLDMEKDSLTQPAKQLLNVRKESMPLNYGDFRTHLVTEGVYAFSRNYMGQTIVTVINDTDTKQEMTFQMDEDQKLDFRKGWKGQKFSLTKDMEFTVTLDPYSYEICF